MNIALLHQLMGPCYQLKSVYVAEVVGYFRAEYPSCSSGIDGPIFNILWVRPHQITERSLVRDLYSSVDGSDLVDGFDLGTESAMNAEYFAWVLV